MKETEMKETEKNIKILKKLGFELDRHGFYTNEDGWGFVIECMPNFKTLIKRYINDRYSMGYEDGIGKKRRQYRER